MSRKLAVLTAVAAAPSMSVVVLVSAKAAPSATTRWFDTHGSRVGTLHLVCSQLTAGRNPDIYCSGIAQLKDGTLTFANGFHLNDELHLAAVTA